MKAQAVEVGSGGESESLGKGKATWGILGRVGNHRARPPERGDLWEGIYGDVGNSRTKSGLTRSEGGQTQEVVTKRGKTKLEHLNPPKKLKRNHQKTARPWPIDQESKNEGQWQHQDIWGMLEQDAKAGQGGGTVGSPGCSNICRKNKASSQGKSKAKTKAPEGPMRLHEQDPAQEDVGRKGPMEGLIQERSSGRQLPGTRMVRLSSVHSNQDGE